MSTYRIRLPRPDHQQQFAEIPLDQLHHLATQLLPQYQTAFDHINQFVLFIGYPRSGHSLVGSLLDAHPNAIIGHEVDPLFLFQHGFSKSEIFTLILANSQEFARVGRGWTGYSYQVPHSHQGSFTTLTTIGDKMGSRVTTHIRQQPHIIDDFNQFIGLKLKFIHHTRNPFDIAGTLSHRRGSSSANPQAIFELAQLAQTIDTFITTSPPIHTDQHEKLIQNPTKYLTNLLTFLNLQPSPSYLKPCAETVSPQPHLSRHKVSWNQSATNQINHLISTHDFFHDYQNTHP